MVASWTGLVVGLWLVCQIDVSETNRVASNFKDNMCSKDDSLDDPRQHEFSGQAEALLELNENLAMKRMQTGDPGLDERTGARAPELEVEEMEKMQAGEPALDEWMEASDLDLEADEDMVDFHDALEVPTCPDHSECPNPMPEEVCATPEGQNYCPVSCRVERVSPPEWCHGCAGAKTHGCINGWRPDPQCQLNFEYRGRNYEGCTADGFLLGRSFHWCSEDKTYNNKYRRCVPCYELAASENDSSWEPVAESLRCLTVAFEVGDRTGYKYRFENNGKTLDAQHFAASGGKWPAVVGISAAVAAGLLTFDTLASEVFDQWWTTDQNDPRSRVKLRHLLSFTSGFINIATTGIGAITSFTHQPLAQKCLTPGWASKYTPEECAKQIYETANFRGEAGLVFDYNSYHLQIAMAMAVKAARMSATEYFATYLFKRAGMTDSYYLGGQNPFLAGGLMTTGSDYANFLRSHLAYHIVPRHVADELETDVKNAGGVENVSVPITFPNYAMGSYKNGECQTMGGALENCLNRERGFYYMIAPAHRDYMAFRASMRLTLPKIFTWLGLYDPKPNVLELGKKWVGADVVAAMQAINIRLVSSEVRADLATAQAEAWAEDERRQTEGWAEYARTLTGPNTGSS